MSGERTVDTPRFFRRQDVGRESGRVGTVEIVAARPGVPILAERDRELQEVGALLKATAGGDGRVVIVEAPAGMGKSAVLRAARAVGEDAGFEVVYARGTESEQDWAYGVVRQLFEPVVAAATGDERALLLEGAGGLAADVVSGSAARRAGRMVTGGQGPLTESAPVFATLHGLYWLAANLAGLRPLLIVVDDAHWADQASLRYLGHLSRRLDGLPIGLLAATRPPEEAPTLLEELIGDHASQVLRLAPLGVGAVAEIVTAATGEGCGDRFAAACNDVTGGNPFLLTELIQALREQGIKPRDEVVGDVVAMGPERVARHFLLRLARLDPAALTLAQVVAVLGPSTDLVAAAAVAGLSLDDVTRAADELAGAGILDDARPLGFVHPIVSTSIAAELSTGRRAAIHASAARHYAADPDSGERSAAHLLAADPVGEPWTVGVLRAAARRALSDGVPDAAVTYLLRAALEPLGEAERGEVLAMLGFAESYQGLPDAIDHLNQAMELIGGVGRRVAVAVGLGRILQLAGQPRRAVELYDRVARDVAGKDRQAELVLRGALLGAAQLHSATAGMVERERRRLLERMEDEPDLPHTIFGPLAAASAFGGEPADVTVSLARRALQNRRLLPEALDRPPYFYHATTALLFVERFDEVESILDESLTDALALGSIQHVVALSAVRSVLNARLGRLADAETDAHQVLELGAPELFVSEAVAPLVDVLVERGELEAANDVLRRAGLEDDVGDTLFSVTVLVARGRLALAEGRPETALKDLLASGELQQRLNADSPSFVAWRSETVPALLRLGRTDEAVLFAEEELLLADRIGIPRVRGRALRAAGLAAAGDERIDLLTDAVDVLGGSGALLEHARALIDLGAELRRSGRRAASRQPLAAGLDGAHRCGAWALVERARTELQAAGARPRRIAVTGVDALTASERRVARMAAAGHTNREIAQTLFVTARTVEGHLTHVFQKLGIASRNELPTVLGGELPVDLIPTDRTI